MIEVQDQQWVVTSNTYDEEDYLWLEEPAWEVDCD